MSVADKRGADHRTAATRRPDRRTIFRWPLWRLQAWGLGLFWFIARCVTIERAALFGQRLLWVIGPYVRRHRHVRRNLAVALPHCSAGQIESLARGVWASFGRVLAEYTYLPEICGGKTAPRIELVAKADLEVFRSPGKPAVFVGAHLANWELCAAAIVFRGLPLTVVYTPERNPLIARMIQEKRQALGCGFVSKSEGLRPFVRELADGRSLGFLIDRRNDQGEPLPFFGLDTPMTVSPARLALRFGCQFVPVRVERVGRSRFRVTLYPPVEPDDATADDHDKALQMTRKVLALFEEWIERAPQEWFCSKRMWPKKSKARPREALKEAQGV